MVYFTQYKFKINTAREIAKWGQKKYIQKFSKAIIFIANLSFILIQLTDETTQPSPPYKRYIKKSNKFIKTKHNWKSVLNFL